MSAPASDENGQRRQPKQPRSVETYNSILGAAATQFAARGYEQTTTHQIAGAAGISVGALYRYFADKQAILLELYRREITEMSQRLIDEFDISDLVGRDFKHIIRRTLTTAFNVYGERAGLRRVLGEQSRKVPALAELRKAQEVELHSAVQRILAAVTAVRLPDLEASAYLITLFIESLIEDYLLHGGESPRFDEQRVLDAGTDFILRYALGKVEE